MGLTDEELALRVTQICRQPAETSRESLLIRVLEQIVMGRMRCAWTGSEFHDKLIRIFEQRDMDRRKH
jgi:hypothetical protein